MEKPNAGMLIQRLKDDLPQLTVQELWDRLNEIFEPVQWADTQPPANGTVQ